jgi:hypothetical protein
MQHWGKIFIFSGIALIIIGALFYLGGNKWSWPGKLPGDFHIKRGNFSFYFPLATSVLLSILLTLILWLWRKLQ